MKRGIILLLILLFLNGCNQIEQVHEGDDEPVNEQEEAIVTITKEEAVEIVREHIQQENSNIEYSHQFGDAFVIHAFDENTDGKVTINWYHIDQNTGDIVKILDTPKKVIGDVNEEVKSLAATIIKALEERDMAIVASYVHIHRGLLFSPYLHIDESPLVFSHTELEEFFNIDTIYTWGVYDGKGTPIELTTEDYFNRFIYNANYAKADELVYDVDISRGNLINNFKDYFENSIFVEFYVEGTEQYGGMDWRSIHLVFDVSDPHEPKLIAIVNDEWTT